VKVNEPSAESVKLFAPLSSNVTEPVSPVTVPPTVWVGGAEAVHATAMLVTLADPTVPAPLLTVQVSPLEAAALTLYAVPDASPVGKLKAPLPIAPELPALASLNVTVPPPVRPETLPPIV